LAERLRKRLFKVVLFGGVTKGLCDVDSNVDLLVVVDRVSDDAKNIVAESVFEISIKFHESIEYIIMSLEEYKSRGKDDPFKYEVKRHGIVLYHDPKFEKEIIKD
jgi:predicted nucleotidyltransferase